MVVVQKKESFSLARARKSQKKISQKKIAKSKELLARERIERINRDAPRGKPPPQIQEQREPPEVPPRDPTWTEDPEVSVVLPCAGEQA